MWCLNLQIVREIPNRTYPTHKFSAKINAHYRYQNIRLIVGLVWLQAHSIQMAIA
jgi:hypothetical protein